MNDFRDGNFVLLAGSASSVLAQAIARSLKVECGRCDIGRFPDGEVSISLRESVRECNVFIIQSTAPPVDLNLIELIGLVDACRRASAGKITAVVPYYGYARSDKRHHLCEPIMASVVAEILHGVGVDHLVTVDLHTAQIEGFFRIPVDSLAAAPILCEELRRTLPPDTVVISPDEGRVKTAAIYARFLNAPVGVVHKERVSGTETRVSQIVGDVRGRACLIIDDMISTGGTIVGAINALQQAGARSEVYIAATHGLLLAGAQEKLAHEAVRAVYVTDTNQSVPNWPGLHIVSIAPLLADSLRKIAGL